MAFIKGDRSEVESLLSKLTTTMDALGRSKRDIELVLKINPHWPGNLRAALEGYSSSLGIMLSTHASLENAVVAAINEALPPG